MAERSFRTEAVVLRSLRLGEADRILHLASLEHGRLGTARHRTLERLPLQ